MRSVGPALLFLLFEVDLLAPLFFPQLLSSFYLRFVLCFLLSFLTRAECSFPPFLQPLFSSLSARRPPFLQGACVCLTSYRKKKNVRVRARLSLLLAHFISSLFFNDSYIYIYTFVDYAAVTTWVMLFLLLHLLPFYNCNDVWINLGATAEVNQSQCLPARVTLFYILFFCFISFFFLLLPTHKRQEEEEEGLIIGYQANPSDRIRSDPKEEEEEEENMKRETSSLYCPPSGKRRLGDTF